MRKTNKQQSPKTLNDVISANVRSLRARRGWNQTDLARALTEAGWPMPTILPVSRIEQGTRRISVDELVALGTVFEVEPWSLTEPPKCDACLGVPPAGFTCNACGASKETPK